MAVAKMQAVSIIGITDHIDEVITVLGESGVFHLDEVSNFYNNIQDFTHLQTKNIYAEPLTNLKASLNLSKQTIDLVDVSDFNPTLEEMCEFADSVSKKLDENTEQKEAASARLNEAKANLAEARHFSGLDVEIEKMLNMKYIKAHFGRLPKDSLQKLETYKDNPYVEFSVCTEDKSSVWGMYFAPNDKEEKINKIFSGLYFEESALINCNETPKQRIETLEAQIPELEKQLSEAEKRQSSYFDENKQTIARFLSKLEELYLYASIRNKAMQYNRSFIIVGWIPLENKKQLKQRLKKIKSIEVDFSDAKSEMEKSPPVKLKNCFLAKPFEFYTEMYGAPKYGEPDPTLFVAITYILLFGVMFADLGQGLCVSIIGWLMWKIKKMKVGKILIPCGISAAVFGTIFGSVFGFEHLLDPLYKALFGLDEKPIEVMASQTTNTIILSAIAIGVVLLLFAMCLNIYSSFRQHNVGGAIFGTSGISGIIFYGSIIFGVVGQMFLGMNILTLPYVICLIIIPFILIFFAEPLGELVNGEENWKPESWGGYIVEHIFESIEVLLGYVTNTMSFLRVGAFVLVHAGMMLVVFALAETVGGIGYWAVVVIGNGLVMALEALLVAIQVLRLEYYEMFSRFYSGEGRAFEPIKLIQK